MPAAPADSAIYRTLLGDDAVAALFTDAAEVRAMMLVEGALARAQGDLGVIPADAAGFLHRASLELQIDPGALATETARNGVPVPALIAAFRKAAQAPEMTQWLHWGATSQDIVDTALALRLRRVIEVWDGRLAALLARLADLAEAHADLPMAARTYGQLATPTGFGAQVASWGRPLLRHRARLAALRADVLRVSLSGAAGTLSAMGTQGPAVRARLAELLALGDPGASWHAERDGMAALSGWMAGLAGTLAKMGEDLILLTQGGLAEVALAGAGGSSTMPQKQNPVGPSAMVALSRQVTGLSAVLSGAGAHRQMRDGAAWFTEWLVLPQMAISTARALALADQAAQGLVPDPVAMRRALQADGGAVMAEAVSFALAAHLPRPEAQARVTALCDEARRSGADLAALAARDWPQIDWQAVLGAGMLGTAPDEARAFAQAVRAG
ncbi:MAG TPA: lyase family protein [Paracoccaceae bacterium]|nr:lyase family protein [Paracoccaceae bacterium]